MIEAASAARRALQSRTTKSFQSAPELSPQKESPVLSDEERQLVVDTFSRILEGLYTHLPQKRAMYGQDPIQRLRLLGQYLKNASLNRTVTDDEFHRRMAEVITDLRDSHTRYITSTPNNLLVDALPILVEYFEEPHGVSGFIVSKVAAFDAEESERLKRSGFIEGVVLTHWNAVPIERAVELYALRETGGRPDAQRARALESLTLRPRYFALRPDAEWVNISFITHDGNPTEVRLDWRCIEMDELSDFDTDRPTDFARALNPVAESAQRVKKMLFATTKWFDEGEKDKRSRSLKRDEHEVSLTQNGPWWTGRFSRNVGAKVHTLDGELFGHLRIWSFDLVDDDGFINEVCALLSKMPPTGLIVDIRSNPGGLIWAAERLMQLFTPNEIIPTGFSMLATDMTRAMASAPHNIWRLEPWQQSLEASVTNGDLYSGAVPMTAPERCNDIWQKYPGPVVCVVDANTYSAGDLFAAGFVDNRLGPLVSVDEGTGAGGANVWNQSEVIAALSGTDVELDLLPDNITYTIAIRRATRTGAVIGMGIEDVGVIGNFNHALTRRDLTEGNIDLLNYCARLLSGYPTIDMQVDIDEKTINIISVGIDRVDIYERNRPIKSEYISKPENGSITINLDALPSELEVIGFAGDVPRQKRKFVLPKN